MGIFSEMLTCRDVAVTTSCAKLTHHHAINQIGTIIHCNSYSAVVAGIWSQALLLPNNMQSTTLRHWPFCLQ